MLCIRRPAPAPWYAAYIFAGGLPYELTEGDILAVFSQYGEIVDVNLVRDKKTGGPLPLKFVVRFLPEGMHDNRLWGQTEWLGRGAVPAGAVSS